MYMKRLHALLLICVFTSMVLASPPADFSGTWVFNPGKSQNLGMMSSLKLTTTIRQTDKLIILNDASSFMGQDQTREVRYDLAAKPITNKTPMGDTGTTVSKWVGNKLITTWTTEGAIAGTKVVMTETRYLSPDARMMTVESVRGTNSPIVMVFDRK